MKTTLQITDDLYDHFISQAEAMQQVGQSVTPEEVIVDRITRFKDVAPSDRVIVIDPKTRSRLETLLSGGSIHDAADLLTKMEKLATVQIGEIKLDFTTAEVRRLNNWGKRMGRPVDLLIKETVDQIKLHVLDMAP